MEQLRFYSALLAAKTIYFLDKFFTKGGGTAAPGLYALRVDPKLIQELSARIGQGTIIVAGTNGKTTAARMLAKMLSGQSISVIHNKEGSNLLRGIASSLAVRASFSNRPIADVALWELDEATLPRFLDPVQPKMIILTNLFRDQLDRYGEVAKIRNDWRKALANLSSDTTLILNADDPSIAFLGRETKANVIYFGIETKSRTDHVATTADANFCPVCQNPLSYEAIYYSHIGRYSCKKCDFARPKPTIVATDVRIDETGSTFTVGKDEFSIKVPGFYNISNALAAIASAENLAVDILTIKKSLAEFRSVFGRAEQVVIGQQTLKLFLVKNPTGFNEVLSITTQHKSSLLVIGINDNFADGRDVSWLWDVDFEKLKGCSDKIICTGIRAYDMANRLKYAEFDGEVAVEQNAEKLLETLSESQSADSIPMLMTYTMMLGFRQFLTKKGYIKHYLEE